ncbi:MAG TPA: chemotaxis protein CheW [Rhodanobacteraceae bacterium]|jgi:chemosensory pili system protein ChpC|nr:chemotaxis protein CheW [Rhodanobacteraceae bacterium]
MNDKQPLPRDIRGVLIPISGGRLLLPNATVSEVITLSSPDRVEGTPNWLLGRIGWRGWRLPLVAFSTLAGLPEPQGVLNSRVTVLKVFGGNPRMPFLALVTQGFPRLTTISDDILVPAGDGGDLPPGVQMQVLVRDEEAIIPDLAFIENEVTRALEAAEAA